MALLLTDGTGDEAADPGSVELLTAQMEGPAGDAPRFARGGHVRLSRLRQVAGVSCALAVGVAVGVRADGWEHERHMRAELDRTVHLDVADVTLRLSSFQISAVDVAVRNDGPRNVVLERLTGEGGAVRPRPGVLPLTLPAGRVVFVRLRFGDRCGAGGGTSTAGRLEARVRTPDGTSRQLALDVVGDAPELQYVSDTVRAACSGAAG